MAGRPLTRARRNAGYGTRRRNTRRRRNAATKGKTQHFIVVYDIKKDDTRKRLHYKLKYWMQPVQRSVMEAALTKSELGKVIDVIEDTINLSTDQVKLYKQQAGRASIVIGEGSAQSPFYPAKVWKVMGLKKAKTKPIGNPRRRNRRRRNRAYRYNP